MTRNKTFLLCLVLAGGLASCGNSQGPTPFDVICGLQDNSLVDPVSGDLPEVDGAADIPGRDGVVDNILVDDGIVPVDTVAVDVARDIPPRGFGAECLTSDDCDSELCIEAEVGFVCTRPCVSECSDGWFCRAMQIGADVRSVCTPPGVNLCKPCLSDTQCGDGVCWALAEGRFCGRKCSVALCPDGYECVDATLAGGLASRQCKPKNGTCSCRVISDGEDRPCIRETADVGTCFGLETCNKDTGWSVCTANEPSVEICDGLDNDCNNVPDDNPVPPGETCTNYVPEAGTCPGVYVCSGKAGWTCAGQMPAVETCNGIDDNCNGDTDETFKTDGKYAQFDHCGQCNFSCQGRILFSKTVVCDSTGASLPRCIVTECLTGYMKINDEMCVPEMSRLCLSCVEDANCGSVGNDRCLSMGELKFCGRDCSAGAIQGTDCPTGYQCMDVEPSVKQCVPLSGTCECTASSSGFGRQCQKSNESGTCIGTETCDSSLGWVNCTAKTPTAETCDGLDNNCNGSVDDLAVPPAIPCESSWENPVSGRIYTCTRDWSCEETGSGVGWVCDAPTPTAEECNGRDDNCDGLIDEDFKVPGTDKYGVVDNCGACGVSCVGLVPHATMKCNVLPLVPTCVVDECDEGYWASSPLSCVEFPPTLCTECASDRGCQVPGDTCVSLSGGTRMSCLWDCSPNSEHPVVDPVRKTCPVGYQCKETDAEGTPFFKCVPLSGACDCLEENRDQVRLCVVENLSGQCQGRETCNPAAGWVGCTALTPAAERCNGIDDDCNGLTDEFWPSLGAVCTAGVGRCLTTGTFKCQSGGADVECSAVAGPELVETCNGLDDDCNGSVDDGIVFADKGKPCFAGVGECLTRGVFQCAVGGLALACSAQPGAEQTELCNGRDDNCDSQIDENWPLVGTFCTVGQGVCASGGVYHCETNGLDIVCSAQAPAGSDEICDGLDNDCDGSVDNGFVTKGKPCSAGLGECTTPGTYQCSTDKLSVTCDAIAPDGIAEICDGLDNDCDGSVDNGFVTKGKPCSAGLGECTTPGTYQCSPDKLSVACDAIAPDGIAEICDGLDNDCDGSVDNGIAFANKGKPCSRGLGECAKAGTYQCSVDKFSLDCDAQEVTGIPEICDGLDNDCNGIVDNGDAFLNKGTVCTLGLGQCVRNGVYVCSEGGLGTTCNAAVVTVGTLETCNYLDDNCDGSTDEDFKTGTKYSAATACGNCYTDCTQIYAKSGAFGTCDSTGTPFCRMNCNLNRFNLNGVPDDGCEFVLDLQAIYVSATDGTDDSNCGIAPIATGQGHPCKGIATGLTRAGATTRARVLVADGLYEETLTMVSGISLMGGYRADTWERHVASSLTIIRGQGYTSTAPGTVNALTITGTVGSTVLSGFHIIGPNSLAAGVSSYGLYVLNSTSALTVSNNLIEGGVGGVGAKGDDGANGLTGLAGSAGGAAYGASGYNSSAVPCSQLSPVPPRSGGAGGSRTCGTTVVNGGLGGGNGGSGAINGNACPPQYNALPTAYENGSLGAGAAPGAGGAGGIDSEAWYCDLGECHTPTAGNVMGNPGRAGGSGSNGTTAGVNGCSSSGQASSGLWQGSAGLTGASGTPGSGGGGGGSGGGAQGESGCSPRRIQIGGSGGGGGSGGCGGSGGVGGASGGGSFAIFLAWDLVPTTIPTLLNNTIRGGQGGAGGYGGNGGSGAPGGSGGVGGSWTFDSLKTKCSAAGAAGGEGGNGGNGEGGGGGCGGPSYGIFATGNGGVNLGSYVSNNTVTAGVASFGGSGGASIGTPGDAGAAGSALLTNF